MSLIWIIYGLYSVIALLILNNALSYHNKEIAKFNAKPLFVIVLAQFTLIPLMIKYF
jgi:hypothetical protein